MDCCVLTALGLEQRNLMTQNRASHYMAVGQLFRRGGYVPRVIHKHAGSPLYYQRMATIFMDA
ncbi:hypothetical protein D3C80_2076360 [compost metagenome]